MDVGKDSNHAHIHHKEMMRSSGESVQSENHHMQHAMKVWFHGGYNEVILFQFWSVNSYTGLLLSCALIFVMASLYEGIKWFRIHLQISRESRMSVSYRTSSNAQKMLEYGVLNGPDSRGDHSEPVVIHNQPREKNNYSPFSIMRITQTALYLMQLILAYWLMLIVMTYNSWLTAAVVTGAAFGHWLFAILKYLNPQADKLDTFATDACH